MKKALFLLLILALALSAFSGCSRKPSVGESLDSASPGSASFDSASLDSASTTPYSSADMTGKATEKADFSSLLPDGAVSSKDTSTNTSGNSAQSSGKVVIPLDIPVQSKGKATKDSFAGITLTEGREFTGFGSAFTNAISDFASLLLDSAETISNLDIRSDFLKALIAVQGNPLTSFSELSNFDMPNMPNGTHILDQPPLEATRQTSGDMVAVVADGTLASNYVFDFNTTSMAQAGDHMSLQALLDTKNLAMQRERILTRGAAYLECDLAEAVVLPDGTMLFQGFYLMGVHEVLDSSKAIFIRISGDSFSAVIANLGGDYNLSYDTIVGNGDMTTEEMSRGYAVASIITVENGELIYTMK